MNFYILILTLLLALSCNIEKNQLDVEYMTESKRGVFNSVQVTEVSVVNDQLVVKGKGFKSVKSVSLDGEKFLVESTSDTKVISNAKKSLSYLIGKTFELVISNAHGDATFSVMFSLSNGSVTGEKIAPMGALNGQVLTYNATDSKWEPRSISGLSYKNVYDASSAVAASSAFDNGDFYVVTTAGNFDPDGVDTGNTWLLGDWAVYDSVSNAWSKIPATNSVISVAGRAGAVTLGWNDLQLSSGKHTGSKLDQIEDVDVTAIADGDVLIWDNTNTKWVTSALPSPAPGNDSVNSTSITNNSIVDEDINSDAAISWSKIDKTGATASQVSAVPLTRTINSKPLNSDITLIWSDLGKTSGKLTDSSLDEIANVDTAAKSNGDVLIWDNAGAKWVAGSLPSSAPSDNSVGSNKIIDGSILDADISNSAAIAWSKINKTGAVATDVSAVPLTRTINSKQLNSDITLIWSDLGKTSGKLTGSSLDEIANVDTAAKSNGDVLIWDNAGAKWVAGSLPSSAPSDNSVGSNKIIDGSILDADISNSAAIAWSKISKTGASATDVGLGSVANVNQLPMSYLDTNTSLAANSDVKVASQKAVKAYVDNAVSGASDNLGNHTASQNIILGTNYLSGDGGNEGIRIDSNGQVGIGTATPASRLHVNGDLRTTTFILPTNAGDGKVLTSDAAGNASWQTSSGGADDLGDHTATQNLKLGSFYISGDGDNEGIKVDSNGSVNFGNTTPALSSSTTKRYLQIGDSNIIDNYLVLGNSSKYSSLRSYAGSLHFDTYNNTGGGLKSNTLTVSTAGYIGIGTSNPNETLDVRGNIELGDVNNADIILNGYSGYSRKIAVEKAGSAAQTGGGVGTHLTIAAGDAYDSPSPTVAGGSLRLSSGQGSTSNIYFDAAGGSATHMTLDQTGMFKIQNRLYVLQNIGVGINIGDSPTHKLQVLGGAKLMGAGTGNILLDLHPTVNRVGIGGTAPLHTYVAGINGSLKVTGDIDHTGSINNISDRRLKEEIFPIKNSLDKIKRLNAKSYYFIDSEERKKHLGFIAQDVAKVFPSLISTFEKDGKEYFSLNYIGLIAPLTEAVKEIDSNFQMYKSMQGDIDDTQDRKIASLQDEVLELKKQNIELKNEVNELKNLVNKIIKSK